MSLLSLNLDLGSKQTWATPSGGVPQPIALFDFKQNTRDLISGSAMTTTLPATGDNKTAELNSQIVYYGEDEPRRTSDGILVEGAATNYIHYSEDFSTSWWTKADVLDISTDGTLAPDGTAAQKVTFDEVDAARVYKTTLTPASTPHVFSIWLKGTSGEKIAIENYAATSSAITVVTFTGEWQRANVIQSTDTTTAVRIIRRVSYGATATEFYCWGAQLEDGINPTSYIPTDGSTVSRATEAADVLSNGYSIDLDDIPLVKAVLQDEGTLVLKWKPKFDRGDNTDSGVILYTDGASTLLYYTGAGILRTYDGTNSVVCDYAYSSDELLTTVVRWSSLGLFIDTAGTSGSGSFSGNFNPSGPMYLHFENEDAIEYQVCLFYNQALTDTEIASV